MPASAEDEPVKPRGTWTLQVENDRVANTDRHYTNGVRIGYVSGLRNDAPMWVRDVLDFLYPFAVVRGGRFGAALGHNIYTPADTDAVGLVADDRPYAGWLYGAVSLHAESHQVVAGIPMDVLDSVELNVGIVGPHAFGEEVQNTFHDLIGVARSNGWDNQLRDEPALALFFERKWRKKLGTHLGMDIDGLAHAGGALGNVFTMANLGLMVRVGDGLETDFGPPHIRPTLSGLEAVETYRDFAWYLFAGAELGGVAHNIFLDGNTFADSHSVERRAFVGEFQAGAAILYHGVRVAFTHVYRSREFDPQPTGDRFGTLSISARF